MTLPPLIAVPPAASVVTLVRAVLPPTAPPKVVVPAVFTVRLKPPLTVLAKLMLPLPVEVSTSLAPRGGAFVVARGASVGAAPAFDPVPAGGVGGHTGQGGAAADGAAEGGRA